MQSLETCHFSLAPNICSSEGTNHPIHSKAGSTPSGWNCQCDGPHWHLQCTFSWHWAGDLVPEPRAYCYGQSISRLVSATKLCNSRLVPPRNLQAADTTLRSWALLASSRNKGLGMTVSLIANTCWSISILMLAPVRDYTTRPSIPCWAAYPQNSVTDALHQLQWQDTIFLQCFNLTEVWIYCVCFNTHGDSLSRRRRSYGRNKESWGRSNALHCIRLLWQTEPGSWDLLALVREEFHLWAGGCQAHTVVRKPHTCKWVRLDPRR